MLEEMVLRLALKAAVHWDMAIDHVSGWASRIGWLLLVVRPPLIFYRWCCATRGCTSRTTW